jgi:hypothetical protein
MNRLQKKNPRIGRTKERGRVSIVLSDGVSIPSALARLSSLCSARALRPGNNLPLSVMVIECCDPWRFDPIHSKLSLLTSILSIVYPGAARAADPLANDFLACSSTW